MRRPHLASSVSVALDSCPETSNFKLACFIFLSLSSQAPPYLADDIHFVSEGPRRRLRSSTDRSCTVSCKCNTFGERSFAAAGPRVWNSLPAHLHHEYITYKVLGINSKCIGFHVASGAQCDIVLICTI